MATTTDEIVVRFKTEGGGEVEETFRRAGAASDQFHQKITKAGSALGDLRIKSEQRVANNIGAIAQSMVSGANAGDLLAIAITRVSESFRGSLLFAGAATTGAAFYQGITRAGEAIIQFQSQLADIRRESLIPGEFLGSERVNKNLDVTISQYKTLSGIIAQSNIANRILQSPIAGALATTFGLGGAFQNLGPIGRLVQNFAQGEQTKAQETGLRQLNQVSDIQNQLNTQVNESIRGDERKAELAKIQADHLERAFAIEEKAAAIGKANSTQAKEALSAEQSYSDYLGDASKKKFDLQDKGLELQRRIISAEQELLPVSEQNLRILGLRAAALRDIASNSTLTVQERAAANVAAGGAEATLQRAQFQTYQQGYNPGRFAYERLLGDQQKSDFDLFRRQFQQDEANRKLYPDLDKRSPLLREYEQSVFGGGKDETGGIIQNINQLIQTLLALPTQLGVG